MLIITYIGGILVPSRHCSILIETPLDGKARRVNDLSIAPIGSTNSKFNQLRLYLKAYPYMSTKSFIKKINKRFLGKSSPSKC